MVVCSCACAWVKTAELSCKQKMDPAFVDNELWHGISTMLRFLWAYLLFALAFAALFLTAHAIIPSLVITGHLPGQAARLRPFIYAAAGVALVIAALLLALTLASADVVGKIWDRYLI